MQKKRSRNPTLRAFGSRLRELRGGLSREQVSRKLAHLGVPLGNSTLSQYEKGTVWAPDPGVLWGLAETYRVHVEDLIAVLRRNRLNVGVDDWRELFRDADAPSTAPSHKGGPDAAARARIRELEDSVREREAFIHQVQEAAIAVVRLFGRDSLAEEDRAPRTSKRGSGSTRRKTG
jgi:transcriptional regulator with XRE-family HTH domain